MLAGIAAAARPTDAPTTRPSPHDAPPVASRDVADERGSAASTPFDDRCRADLTPAERRLIQATRARLRRSAPGEAPPALFHNSASWGCARVRFRIDPQGLAYELNVDYAWPDWTYARAAYRLVQRLHFQPAASDDANALIVINLAGGELSE